EAQDRLGHCRTEIPSYPAVIERKAVPICGQHASDDCTTGYCRHPINLSKQTDFVQSPKRAKMEQHRAITAARECEMNPSASILCRRWTIATRTAQLISRRQRGGVCDGGHCDENHNDDRYPGTYLTIGVSHPIVEMLRQGSRARSGADLPE